MTLDLSDRATTALGGRGEAGTLKRRPRRLRRTPAMRAFVRETRLHASMLAAPLFVCPGSGVRKPIASMPGQSRMSPDVAAEESARLADLGVGGVILFGLPERKDAIGSDFFRASDPAASADGLRRSSCGRKSLRRRRDSG